jgi:histidine ammonia-lyase
MDFRAPDTSSPLLETAKTAIRAEIPFYGRDRYFATDLEWSQRMVLAGGFKLPQGIALW